MLRFENIWVADGRGNEPFRASVLTDGASIVEISRDKFAGFSAADTIDGRGLVLAPGFIDAHGHSDLSLLTTLKRRAKYLRA